MNRKMKYYAVRCGCIRMRTIATFGECFHRAYEQTNWKPFLKIQQYCNRHWRRIGLKNIEILGSIGK